MSLQYAFIRLVSSSKMVSGIITNIDYKIVDYDEYKDKRKNFLMPES